MTTVLRGAEAIRAHLGLKTASQVSDMARKGKLPHFREGHFICTTPDLLDAWIKAREAEVMARFKTKFETQSA